jgi:hypothetical protein
VSRELAKYKSDLVGVHEVRWVKGGTEPAQDDIFFRGNGNADHHSKTGFLVHKGIITGTRVESVSDRLSYIILIGCWCDIIVLNVHEPTRTNMPIQRTASMRN